jgi:hypothetical protein
VFALVALLTASPCRAAEKAVFPGVRWDEATPESQGVDGRILDEAAALLRAVGSDGARELVIVRLGLDGKAKDDAWNAFFAKIAESLKRQT